MYDNEQINQLKDLASSLGMKIDLITKLNVKAHSHLDEQELKNVNQAGADLKRAMSDAENGDLASLNNFIQKHANTN